jgi:hypothetical protein
LLTVRQQQTNQTVVSRVEIAESYYARAVGLIGRKRLEEGSGLLLRKCSSVHTFFMNFPIDVLYLDDENRVIAVETNLKPWRFGGIHRGAKQVLELRSMTAGWVTKGDTLIFEEGN